MRHFVFSTLTKDHKYTQWDVPADKNQMPTIRGVPVIIKGGANRATFPEGSVGLHTPKGVVTEVSDQQMEYLDGCWKFKQHCQRGFLIVTSADTKPEIVAKDMEPKDNSAPLTPDSPEFQKEGMPSLEGDSERKLIDKIADKVKQAMGR